MRDIYFHIISTSFTVVMRQLFLYCVLLRNSFYELTFTIFIFFYLKAGSMAAEKRGLDALLLVIFLHANCTRVSIYDFLKFLVMIFKLPVFGKKLANSSMKESNSFFMLSTVPADK